MKNGYRTENKYHSGGQGSGVSHENLFLSIGIAEYIVIEKRQ